LEKEKENYEKNIIIEEKKYIEKYNNIRNIEEVKSELNNELEKIVVLEEKKRKHEENIKNINIWQSNYEIEKKYTELSEKLNSLIKLETEARNKYSSAIMLKDNILEAESISLLNIIDSINIHAQIYLDYFFVDNPISVRLLPFKETKKNTKAQINIEIEYKSMECDFNSLSGGEQARVILAFTLALAEIFNTPLLLLDECTSSLDQETTNIVFDALKEHYKGKLSLVIAHQVITGNFDKILKIN
jgi:DNA repair exonuclease SbcCD ATPase subunit